MSGFLQLLPLADKFEFEKTARQYLNGSKAKPSRLSSFVSVFLAFNCHKIADQDAFLALYGHAKNFLETDKAASDPLKTAAICFTVSALLTGFCAHVFS
jgi:hypothetical protein